MKIVFLLYIYIVIQYIACFSILWYINMITLNSTTLQMPQDDKDSAARNLDDELGNIRADRKLPEEGERKERGTREFIYVKPEEIRRKVSEKLKAAAKPEVLVTAEDAIKTGFNGLSHVLAEEKLEIPKHLTINSGEKSYRDFSLAFHGGKVEQPRESEGLRFNIYAVTDTGEQDYNRDGIVVNSDEKNIRLNVFLAHGPQFDTLCASRTNAAAIKAAYEMTINPDIETPDLVKKTRKNVDKVEEEYGEANKEMDITSMQLEPSVRYDISTLRINNLGKNHCIIIAPDTGHVTKIPPSKAQMETEVRWNEIIIVVTDELLQLYEGFREDAEKQLGNKIFMEAQKGKTLKQICDEIIKDARDSGLDTGVGMIALRVPEWPGAPTVEDVIGKEKREDEKAPDQIMEDTFGSAIIKPDKKSPDENK
jgi:hypothetical protein